MKKNAEIFLIIIFLAASFNSVAGQPGKKDLDYYRRLNEEEKRLLEFKDDDKALILKLAQLDVINQSRKRYRLAELDLDILSSRVANRQCREAALNGYLSHWNMAGEKPYHRYAFAGGYDHVSENAFGEWSSDDYENSESTIASMMKAGHTTFMKEKAPYDGHKKNILEKAHNYVGIGFFLKGGQFRYYEEFIDRYIDFKNVPSELKVNEEGRITVDTRGESFLYFVTIYREKNPEPMKVSQLMKTGSYGDFSGEVTLNIPVWNLAKYRNGSIYNIPVRFSKEGLYYIHIYTDRKENTGVTSADTKGKSPVSGIVIRVKR